MFENLINLINKQDLEALREAVKNNDNGKEALPEILQNFQNDFDHPPKYIKDFSPDKDFDEKLELLLEFYQNYEAQEITYTALNELKRERMLAKELEQKLFEKEMAVALMVRSFEHGLPASIPAPTLSSQQMNMNSASRLTLAGYTEIYKIRPRLEKNILDRVSGLAKKGKMDKVAIQGLIGRLITPDQSFSSENSGKPDQDKVLLEKLYDPLIPEDAKEAFNALYIAVLQILADDNKPFAEKLENMFSLYRAYEDILGSKIELFLYPAEMEGKSWLLEDIEITENGRTVSLRTFIKDKVKEGEESFFTDEALKQEIVAAYLKALFQYMGNKITFEVKELGHAHKEILELPVFQTISKVFEKHRGLQSLREVPKKEKDELIERFNAEIVDKKDNTVKQKLADEKQKIIEKINILWSISIQEEKNAAYEPLQDAIIKHTGKKSLEGYVDLIDYLSDEKDSSILNRLNPRSLKSIIDSDKDIQRLIEEAKVIVDEIKRLQACLIACDDAIKSLGSLKGSNTPVASPISTASSASVSSTSTGGSVATMKSATVKEASTPKSGSLRIGRKKLSVPSENATAVESSNPKKSFFNIGGGFTKRVTSSVPASTSSAPVKEGTQEAEKSVGLANPVSAPVVSPASASSAPVSSTSVASFVPVSFVVSPTTTGSRHTTFSSAHHSSRSSTPTSPSTTLFFGQHRSTVSSASVAPVPTVPEEQNIPEASAASSESSAPANADPNDKAGTTTMKKG